MQCQLSKFPSPASSFPPTPATTATALVLSSFALGREGGVETLCLEGIKLTCRMEAAREERNRINQPPSPTTYTHTGAMDLLSHQQEHPVLPTTAAHAEFYAFLHIPGHAPGPPRQECAPNSSGGLPGQLQRGQLLQGVSRAPRSPLWRLSGALTTSSHQLGGIRRWGAKHLLSCFAAAKGN